MIVKFVKEDKEMRNLNLAESTTRTLTRRRMSFPIDIKGVAALSVTITSFLIALTLIQIGVDSQNIVQIAGAFIVSASIYLCHPREKDRASFSGLKITKTQHTSTFIHLADSCWYYYVYDLSNYSQIS